jgi:hypothetical protein
VPPEVNSANCQVCKGAQWVYAYEGEEVIPRRCSCLEKQLLLSFLGPEIFGSKPIASPLYQPYVNAEGEIEGDRTEDNLFIKGSWRKVCQHFHWALAGKRRFSSTFQFKIATDVNLLSVWFGKESYKERSTKERNDIETYNSLSDFLADPTLVILRLGHLGYTNRAAAGVLKEALGIREVLFKPTWIVEGTDCYFGPGHRAYDDDVASYIDERFDVLDLGGNKSTDDMLASLNLSVEGDISMGPGAEPPKPNTDVPVVTSSRFEAVIDPQVEVRRKSKQYRPGNWKKKQGGSGLPDW